jgi:hypothetical protein
MLWIKDVIESTPTPPFLTNSRIDMVNFVDPHKVIIKRSAFSVFPNAQDENENKILKKPWEKKERKRKRPKVNLIFSCQPQFFWYLDLGIEPQTFRHTH